MSPSMLLQGYQNFWYLLGANFLEAVLTRSIWLTSDILFGSMSLGLIDEHPPYLVVWLGGQNHISTRPHRDRSDTVGILPAVKCRRMGAWGAEPKYCSKKYYSETKHIAEIPTLQRVLFCLAKDSFCSPA